MKKTAVKILLSFLVLGFYSCAEQEEESPIGEMKITNSFTIAGVKYVPDNVQFKTSGTKVTEILFQKKNKGNVIAQFCIHPPIEMGAETNLALSKSSFSCDVFTYAKGDSFKNVDGEAYTESDSYFLRGNQYVYVHYDYLTSADFDMEYSSVRGAYLVEKTNGGYSVRLRAEMSDGETFAVAWAGTPD